MFNFTWQFLPMSVSGIAEQCEENCGGGSILEVDLAPFTYRGWGLVREGDAHPLTDHPSTFLFAGCLVL